MFSLINIKKHFILLLFSISIFFSYVDFFFLELRFLYLIPILLIFFDKNFFNHSNKKIIYISLIIFLFLSAHYVLNNTSFNSNYSDNSLKNFLLTKSFIQVFVISISVFVIYYFKEILLLNLKKIFDYFLILFTISILAYNLANSGILFDTLYKCDLGFFYYTRFIFYENSHFGIIAVAVILNFIYNFEYYLEYKILFLVNILFIIFTFGNFSLSFYLCSLFSVVLFFVSLKSLEKYKLILLILFLILSNFFLLNGKKINKFFINNNDQYCVSHLINLEKKYKLNKHAELFKGRITTPLEKLSIDIFKTNTNKDLKYFFKNDIINFSTGVYVYSFYVAKEALLKNPFGYGIHNYKNYREIIDKKMINEDGYHKAGLISLEIFSISFRIPNVLDLNLNSGSNNFSKIIVEFGLFGILLFIFYSIIIFSRNINDEIKFVLFPFIFGQLLIRGTGYFQSGFLIITIILIIIIMNNFFKNER